MWFDVLLAVLGGAIRVGTPFLFVSLGECLTEKSGRINLGLEGVLVFSAMAGFAGSYLTGQWWLGVLLAGASGALIAALHGLMSSLPRVNDIAAGIAIMMLGAGLAFYLGKPLIQPQAEQIPSLPLGAWSSSPNVQAALSKDRRLAMERHEWGQRIFLAMADVGPAMGMIGTLVGLVQMLANMDDPKSIGPAMAVALLTTLYGSLLANVICMPIADKLKLRGSEEAMQRALVVDGLLAIQAGQNPRVIQGLLERYLPEGRRPATA